MPGQISQFMRWRSKTAEAPFVGWAKRSVPAHLSRH
jgi:hypothetical protein